jgi:transcriptional regulator with XRE-family HTH domain
VKAASPARATRIDRLVAQANVEQMVAAIMENQQISAAELARRVNSKPPQISRELRGGLRRATLNRIAIIAEALDCDFLPLFVPRQDSAKRKKFLQAHQDLMSPNEPAHKSNGSRPSSAARKDQPSRRSRATA